MNERERLSELILDSGELSNHCYAGFDAENLADYLLANGVVVLPCKVGDMVYAISRGDIIPIAIDRIQRHNRGIDIFGRNEKYFGYGTIMLDCENKIGLKWYKTKEEAEQALKGGGAV